LLPGARIAKIDDLVKSEPVMIFGMRHSRCLAAASERLEGAGACFQLEGWDRHDDPLWLYMQCLHPNEFVNGMMMHSYVYIGGQYVGNGFALLESAMSSAELTTKLTAASVRLTCGRDCDALATPQDLTQLAAMKREPLALLGWSGCPCTNIVRSRFESVGACYVQKVWADDTAPLYKYLQCVHGQHHHSFVFVGGNFVGDGFEFEEGRLPERPFAQMLDRAGAQRMCQRRGDENLFRQPLKSCTQSNDGSTTGWTRTGSCNWDPSDSGYHEVCVAMSDEFLKQSARHDANDLSSVVQSGGHWCICAWAWASAVQRDPQAYEGITLECERTNHKLRDVYEEHISTGADLRSPSGASYKAKAALDAVDRLCPPRNASTSAAAVGDGKLGEGTAAPVVTPTRQHMPALIFLAMLVVAVWMGLGSGRAHCFVVEQTNSHERLASERGVEEDKLGYYDSGGESGAECTHDSRAKAKCRAQIRAVPATPETKAVAF
jgi:uncharacterized protein (DUF2237 family)